MQKVLDYIAKHWDDTVRMVPRDEGRHLGLPEPFIVPCAKAVFCDLYYWDSFFASVGLVLHGRTELALSTCNDFFALVRRLGKVPNASILPCLNRSQPPLLGALTELVYSATHDDPWLKNALPALDAEYDFWMTKRSTPCGLNRHGHDATPEELLNIYDSCGFYRLGMPKDAPLEEQLFQGGHLLAEAETGWDFTPRFQRRCLDFAPVDLNAILYGNELRLAKWHEYFGNTAKAEAYREAARKRAELMEKFCYDSEKSCYFDYDFVNDRRSEIVSCAAFYPLWFKCTTDPQRLATVGKTLADALLSPYGVRTCKLPQDPDYHYQWDALSIWPPLQYAAIKGLQNAGLDDLAMAVAKNFTQNVVRQFEQTGDLWEKYNSLTGEVQQQGTEYGTPAMMGWTAGIFTFCAMMVQGKSLP